MAIARISERSIVAERTLTSLALLQVNWDRTQQDYIDNLVPFVAEALRQMPQEIVGLTELTAAVREIFGLHLQPGPLKTILKRCVRKGFVTIQGRAYVREAEALTSLTILHDRELVLRQQGALIQGLSTFAGSRYGTSWSEESSWNALLEYVREDPVTLLAEALEQQPIPPPSLHVPYARLIVGSFVEHLRLRDPNGYFYFCNLVKGSMLSSVLLYPDLAKVSRRFDRTAVFFDTKLLQQALELEGKEVAEPLLNVLKLLRAEGAELRCFEHTVDELRSNLHSLADELRLGNRDSRRPSEMFEHFVVSQRSPSDVELIVARIEDRLRGLHIIPTQRPEPIVALTLDETRLADVLQDTVRYKSERARQHDLDAITAVHRLRDGRTPQNLESSRAIFLTNNNSLAAASAHFFRREYPHMRLPVPHCMTDHLLATLVWLKQPSLVPELPQNRLVADVYAAINPPDEIWRAYLLKIAQHRERGEVSEGDYHLLRHDITAKRELMHLTLGEPEAFVDATVPQVLARARALVRADLEDELQLKNQEIAQTLLQRVAAENRALAEKNSREASEAKATQDIKAQEERQREQLALVARRIARGTRITLFILGAIPLVLAVWSTIPADFPPPPSWLQLPQIATAASLLLLFVLTVSGLLEGFSMHSALAPLESWVAQCAEVQLRRLFEAPPALPQSSTDGLDELHQHPAIMGPEEHAGG